MTTWVIKIDNADYLLTSIPYILPFKLTHIFTYSMTIFQEIFFFLQGSIPFSIEFKTVVRNILLIYLPPEVYSFLLAFLIG